MPPRRKTARRKGPERGSVQHGRQHETPSQSLLCRPFPQELVDLIIDELYDDFPTLQICSLTSRSFLSSSRRHQFSHIEFSGIQPPNPPTRQWRRLTLNTCEKFHALISESPHIAPLVRDLRVVEGSNFLKVTWLATEPLLPVVLRKLVNLTSISLEADDDVLLWTALSHRLRESLSELFRSPKLETARFNEIDLPHPSEFFRMFEGSNLKHLLLSANEFAEEGEGTESYAPNSSLCLESLELDLDHLPFSRALEFMLKAPSVDLSNLGVLYVSVSEDADLPAVRELLQKVSGSLRQLRVHKAVLDDQWNGFDVACLSHLTSITFEATLAYYDGPEDDYDPLRWIPGILDTIPRTTAITTVRVEVIVDGELGDRDTMNDIIPPSWKRMEAFVLQANLHVPREIVVTLHPVTVFDRFTCQNLRACLFRMMPDLDERELLTIEITEIFRHPWLNAADPGLYW